MDDNECEQTRTPHPSDKRKSPPPESQSPHCICGTAQLLRRTKCTAIELADETDMTVSRGPNCADQVGNRAMCLTGSDGIHISTQSALGSKGGLYYCWYESGPRVLGHQSTRPMTSCHTPRRATTDRKVSRVYRTIATSGDVQVSGSRPCHQPR